MITYTITCNVEADMVTTSFGFSIALINGRARLKSTNEAGVDL